MIRPLVGTFEDSGRVGQIVIGVTVLVVLVVGLGYSLLALRRWWLGEDESCASAEWTLQDLRDLRAKGELTEAEYASLRAASISGVRGTDTASDDIAADNERGEGVGGSAPG